MIIEPIDKDPVRVSEIISQNVSADKNKWSEEGSLGPDFICVCFDFFGWNDTEVFEVLRILWLEKYCCHHITLCYESTETSPGLEIWISRPIR